MTDRKIVNKRKVMINDDCWYYVYNEPSPVVLRVLRRMERWTVYQNQKKKRLDKS